MNEVDKARTLVEQTPDGAPVQVNAEGVPIIDPGVGKGVILRHFFFKALPRLKGQKAPTKLEMLNHFKRLIEMSLWGDGLIIREDKPIEVHTRKAIKNVSPSLYQKMRDEGADFAILCLAEPRFGVSIVDTFQRAK